MVRSGMLPQATLGGKHLSAPQVLAPRRDPLQETRLNIPRFLNTGVLNRLHPMPINQHAQGSNFARPGLCNREPAAQITQRSLFS